MLGRPTITAAVLLGLAAILLLFFVAFKFGQFSVVRRVGSTKFSALDQPVSDETDPMKLRVAADFLEPDSSNPDKRWVEILSWKPRILLYHNILTKQQCDRIVAFSEPKVSRSSVVGGDGKPVVNMARTSSGYFVVGDDANDEVMKLLESRIAEWTHLPVENGEAFYVLRYEVGQQYVPHTDFFDESNEAQRVHQIGPAGNRVATVITCLRSPDGGGETTFPHVKIDVPCRTGNAVLFWDSLPNALSDPTTLHGGKPVTNGTKWAMTKWIRPRKFGF